MASNPPSLAQRAQSESEPDHARRLIQILDDEAQERTLKAEDRHAALEQLKVYSRKPNLLNPLYTEKTVDILCKHAFVIKDDDDDSAREALRVLANAMLTAADTRQYFVTLDYPEKAAKRFKSESVDDEFVLSRILFLITYGTTVKLAKLMKEDGLEENVNAAISRHLERQEKQRESGQPATPMEQMAFVETLKLMFNTAHFLQDEQLFADAAPALLRILTLKPLPAFPLVEPIVYIINALLNADLSSAFPSEDETIYVHPILEILRLATVDDYTQLSSKPSFDEAGTPLITLLRKLHLLGPDSVKTLLKKTILPSESDRALPLGQTPTLPSRLLRLCTSASAPTTREHISFLLFELSNSNAAEFTENIGYGYASGFLATHAHLINTTPTTEVARTDVNPITGQKHDAEPNQEDPFKGMSDEEKEREAERLFVLFERWVPMLAVVKWIARARGRRRRPKKGA